MQTPLVFPPLSGSEKELVLGFITFQQQIFLRKLEQSSGELLSEEQLAQPVAPTSMTLKGMAAHLWFVEDYWREKIILGKDMPEPWKTIDWEADNDADWHTQLPIGEVLAGLKASTSKTNSMLQEADWDQLSAVATGDGKHFSIRCIAVHLLEEWARHLGHADLLRENIDGAVGN